MSGKKKKAKAQNVKIYARVRNLMPWEPRQTSLTVKSGNKLTNKTTKHTNEYSFSKVFGIDITNAQIYKVIVQPMIDNVLKGFNALLIAYGQTGSGKTFSMLGKPNLGVIGLLPMMLQEIVEQSSVFKLELSCVEAFGHHVAKIELFDLYDPINQTPKWVDKKGDTSLEMNRALKKEIKDIDQAYEMIKYAHAASHFAPTGKNPESSRGHVTFVAKVHQNDPNGTANDLVSYFIMLDCAGSEGETAFTPDFIASVDKTTLMARRLEAGCINTGLSSLQVIFNELRVKGKLSAVVGNGLRRVLHPFINTQTFLAVLFTFSPSVNNSQATESTLKFAVTAGMVKVAPVKAQLSVNIEKLVQQLRAHIEENDKLIEVQNNKIVDLRAELEMLKQGGLASGELPDDYKDDNFDVVEEVDDNDNSNGKKKKKGKGRNLGNLAQSVLDKFAYLDESSDEEDYQLDDMFKTTGDDKKAMEALEKELSQALKENKKHADGRKIVKDAVGIDLGDDEKDYDENNKSNKKVNEALEETLNAAKADISELQTEMDPYGLFDDVQVEFVDYTTMNNDEITEHCEQTWDQIEDNKEEQKKLQQSQQHVVSHLVDTNEWLFSALNEVLNSTMGNKDKK